MLSYEQLAPALHKWAYHYSCSYRDFEYWELINAVWAMGAVQKLDVIQFASMRVSRDMIDYMRSIKKIRMQKRLEKSGRSKVRFFSLDQRISDNEENGVHLKDRGLSNFIGCTRDKATVEEKDFFEWLTRGFDRRTTLIIYLYYKENMIQHEIAKVIGLTESRVSQIHESALERMKARIIRVGLRPFASKRENPVWGTKNPYFCYKTDAIYKSKRASYQRWYFLTHKAQIKARRLALEEERKLAL